MCFLSPIPEKIYDRNEKVTKAFRDVDQALDLLALNLSKKSVYYELVQRANKVVKNVLNEDASQMWTNEQLLIKMQKLTLGAFETLDTRRFFLGLATIKEDEKEP